MAGQNGAFKCELKVFGFGGSDMLVEPPRFSWSVMGKSGIQAAYRLNVREREGACWDSGWIESKQSAQVFCEGLPLRSNRDYYASVQVRAADGSESDCSRPACYSTGLLDASEWKAGWLVAPEPSPVLPMFRKEFRLEKPVKRARLYLSGLGYYEAYLNGKKVGDRLLDPAWTDYRKRVCYVAYDVTGMLAGQNVLGILLGAGWYANQELSPRPTFSAQLMLEYKDGGTDLLLSDTGTGWYSHSDGPMRACTLYIGEMYDACKEKDGWSESGFYQDDSWKPALEGEPPEGKLLPMHGEPIRVVRELPACSVTGMNGDFIVDFGQNLAGIVELTMDCPAGTEVRIRYAELLWPDGALNTLNLRTAQQQDIYIARGGGETYRSRFTYHGFRYAEITGLPKLQQEQIKALVLRSDVADGGRFQCSYPLLNQIQEMCVWTESNNLHSVPTDCPQRDERLGWLNDLTVRAEEAICNFDMSHFYRKFLFDIADAQGAVTGAITDTVPYNRYGGQPADAVCSSYLIVPWLLYLHYGDEEVLSRHYDGLVAWTNYLSRQREQGIVTYSYYGDWAAPIAGTVAESVGSGAVSRITPGPLMSTGFLYMNAHLMEQIATVLGKEKDAAAYRDLAEETKEALNLAFLNKEQGYYGTGSQAANTFPLYLNIVPKEYRQKVLDHLVQDILAHDTHTTTGNLCSRYIFDVLAQNGQIDLAYDLVTQETYPSWGYMCSKGATTTWERWEYVEDGPLIGMASHDHPMYSSISGWFYTHLLGLRPLAAGFSEFAFRPYLPAKLEQAFGELYTVKGTIKAGWRQSETEVQLTIEVPFNSVCRLTLPAGGQAECNGETVKPHKADKEAYLLLEPGKYEIMNPK